MLFISRIFRDNILHPDDEFANPHYGVVDTDDNVEEIVPWLVIFHACVECGLTIQGVEIRHIGVVHEITSITPYQSSSTMTPLQAKTALISHVHITVYAGCITSIRWNPEEIQAPVSVRLSDFGSSVSDFCLIFNNYASDYVVTLALDDKLDFSSVSFSVGAPHFVSAEGLGVKYDLREMLDDAKAEFVYNSVGGTRPLDSIIDRPDRYNRMATKLKTWG